jgi:tRNA 2-selenouridine synthase
MRRVAVKEFLLSDPHVPIVDVRSPGEFAEGHILGATNIPLFSDAERAQVGTTYTKIGKSEALELGLEFVGPKMNALAKKAKSIALSGKIKVHCWRGGMRSDKMAWLFDLVGLEVTILEGGYKAFRNQLLADFENLEHLIVLHGPTGCGKTAILHKFVELGEQVIDLEGRANHKGSAFGALGMGDQPNTAQFQNMLYSDLLKLDFSKRIWVESESLSIGKVYLPQSLWDTMNHSSVIELDLDKELRAKRIVAEYGSIDIGDLANSIRKIQTRFGGNRVKQALELLEADKLEEVVLLLLEYYDKSYSFSKNKYKKKEVASHIAKSGDPAEIAEALIKIANQLNL